MLKLYTMFALSLLTGLLVCGVYRFERSDWIVLAITAPIGVVVGATVGFLMFRYRHR